MQHMPLPRISLLILFCIAAGCADPRLPTGGPPDKTPPELVATEPTHETVSFVGSTVRLEFSEYVDQASFLRAVSITPAPQGRIRYRWRKRRVDIRFPGPLRDQTTYLITLDNNLRDVRGVALKSPLTIAFSTGPRIDQGRIVGDVLEPLRGAGAAGMDIFAYALPDSIAPDSLPDSPDYRTQTDEEGRFVFTHLREQPYFILGLQDRNRNGVADATEPYAVAPFAAINAAPDTTAGQLIWVVTRRDTLRPAVQRVRALSHRRLQVRFTEKVVMNMREPESWALEDSTTGRPVLVNAVYQLPTNPREVFLATDSLSEGSYGLRPDSSLTDSSGNAVLSVVHYFGARAVADTMRLRFIGFYPEEGSGETLLFPRERPMVLFNAPVPGAALATIIKAQDSTSQAVDVRAATEDGTTYVLEFSPPLSAEYAISVHVDAGAQDSVYVHHYRRISEQELGSVSGWVVGEEGAERLMVELYAADAVTKPVATMIVDSTGAFSFARLKEASYTIRAYDDHNGNRRWDGGDLLPFAAAETIAWSAKPVSVRPRWDTALSDTLFVPARDVAE